MTEKFDKHDDQRGAGGNGAAVPKKLIAYGGYYTNNTPNHDPELT